MAYIPTAAPITVRLRVAASLDLAKLCAARGRITPDVLRLFQRFDNDPFSALGSLESCRMLLERFLA